MRIVIVIALFVTLVLTACGGTAPTAMASPTPLTVLALTPEATATAETTPTPLPAVTTTAIPVPTTAEIPMPIPTATAAPATPIAVTPAPTVALTPTPPASPRITPTTVVTTINPGTPTRTANGTASTPTRGTSTVPSIPTRAATSTARVPTRTAAATGTPAHGNQLEMLTAGERQWQQGGIVNYRIVVTDANFARIQTNTITVRNGIVVDQSATCTGPAIWRSLPCKVQPFNAMDYIVPGLFARAQDDLANTTHTTTITIDPHYGYPRVITTHIPNLYDSEHDVRVVTFTVL